MSNELFISMFRENSGQFFLPPYHFWHVLIKNVTNFEHTNLSHASLETINSKVHTINMQERNAAPPFNWYAVILNNILFWENPVLLITGLSKRKL